MSKLVWDNTGERLYETGVQNGVLYPRNVSGLYPKGVAWNGLISVTESPTGAESNKVYADNITYLNLISAEEFGATIEAYTYPDEFAACDGSGELAVGVFVGQQTRNVFGLAYKSFVGNDVAGNDFGYKLHLIYGGNASPSEKAYATINDTPEAITFSWEVTTTPVEVTGFKPTASLTIDSTKVDTAKLAALETILFGSANADARLPLPDEVADIFAADAPSALALSSIVPDDDETDVAIDSTIVLTFNNKIDSETITVASEGGDLVAGSKSWNATGKILTFTPTASLTNATMYIVTIAGVADIYGQSMATVVKNFMTVND
jgi:hypothetical protein